MKRRRNQLRKKERRGRYVNQEKRKGKTCNGTLDGLKENGNGKKKNQNREMERDGKQANQEMGQERKTYNKALGRLKEKGTGKTEKKGEREHSELPSSDVLLAMRER